MFHYCEHLHIQKSLCLLRVCLHVCRQVCLHVETTCWDGTDHLCVTYVTHIQSLKQDMFEKSGTGTAVCDIVTEFVL